MTINFGVKNPDLNITIPESVRLDFEPFCKKCTMVDLDVQTDKLTAGSDLVYTRNRISCSHINACRMMFQKRKS